MFVKATILASLAATALAQSTCSINTPSAVVECQPSLVSWSASEPPYIVTIIPGGQSQAEALRYLADKVTTTQVTWNVDLEAGNSITFKLVDGTGATCYSAPVTIQAGTSTECFNSGSSSAAAGPSDGAEESGSPSSAAPEEPSSASAPAESGEASSAAPPVSVAPTTAAPATQAPTTAASSKAAASSHSAASSVAASPTPTSGAQKVGAAFGAVAAAVAAALF